MFNVLRLLAAGVFALLCGAASAQSYPPASPAPTQHATTSIVVRQQVMKNTAVFFGNTSPTAYQNFPPNTWHRIDLKPWGVPADAQWAYLTGILIITHNGDASQLANLMVGVRLPGDTETGNCDTSGRYNGQVAATAGGGGARSPMATYAPLANGELEICWSPNPNVGLYPSVPAVGATFHLQAWGVPPVE